MEAQRQQMMALQQQQQQQQKSWMSSSYVFSQFNNDHLVNIGKEFNININFKKNVFLV